MKLNKKQINFITFAYCMLNAIIFLFICSKSSPLYCFNDWSDANSFFTMGKGMANGLIIYRDLFEQKGPILYLIHAIGYIIANTSFFGIFVLEILSFTTFLYFISKTIVLYCRRLHILWSLPLISFTILSSFVFVPGDSAEEFCLPLIAINMYYFFNYYKNVYPNKMDTKQLIINGFIVGCILWTKYTLLGFGIGFIFFICLGMIINKKIKEAFIQALCFLLGMFIASVPWLIYFAVNGALYDLFYVYFWINISSYSEQTFIIKRIAMALIHAIAYAKNLWLYSIITIFGYLYFMKNKKLILNKYGKIALTFTIILSIICVYYGANYRYYFLILMPYIILGVIAIAKLIEKVLTKKITDAIICLSPIYMLIFIMLACLLCNNFGFRKIKKEDLVQYQFSEIMKKYENPTLLNYGFLDGGFYTISNIVPNVKYFSNPNIKYENFSEILNEQNRYIKEKLIDFVIVKLKNEEESYLIPKLNDNYEKIKSVEVQDETLNLYILYKLKEL